MDNKYDYDVAIIGAGPAACTAALYTSRAKLKTLIIEGDIEKGIVPGGQLTTTTEVENFPGFPEGIDGTELVDKMKEQAERFGTSILSETIIGVNFTNKLNYELYYKDNKKIKCKSVIICTGAIARKLVFKNSDKFWNKGISACAVCDGGLPMFRNKPLAVIGGGDSAMEEATFLSKYASKVYLIHRRDTFRASKIMQERVFNNNKIEILYNYIVKGADGQEMLSNIEIESTINNQTKQLEVNGLFFAIGHEPMTNIFKNYINLDNEKYIITEGESTKTNIPGVFAAGDVKDKKWRQAITAAGSGCIAALEVEEYLQNFN